MNLLIASLLCVAPLIAARSLGGRETDTCIADYLKDAGLIESSFGSDKPLNPLCSAIVDVTKRHILESVRLEVLSDKDMRGEEACIMKSLKQSDFGNSLLVMYVYETAENMDEALKAEKLKAGKTRVTEATFNSFFLCQADKKFGQIFDEIVDGEDSSSSEETDPMEDYCIRKHIVDHKLIDADLTLQVNPKNLDVSNVDCTVLYQKALKEAEDDVVKAMMDQDQSSEEGDAASTKPNPGDVTCLLGVIRNGNYIDQMLQFDYVKELNLSQAKKTEMRSEFIAMMTKLAGSASKCFL